MAREYELWLDESGKFENEKDNASDLEQFPKGFHPSLIGGWLVDYGKCNHSDFERFVISAPTGDEHHAAGMNAGAGKRMILDGMKTVHETYGGRIVLFENKELKDYGNRELYLRLMASGLLQLLQELNATSESIKLHVIIARRMDMTAADNKEIEDKEYINMLGRYISAKKRVGHIRLHEDTEMSIAIDSARKDNRLKMADYVCNTELTLHSGKFSEKEKSFFADMTKDAFAYSFEENTTANIIEAELAQGNIADALVETVFNTKGSAFTKMLKTIGNKISTMGYRGAKVQLDQCTKEFTTYVYMEDDFERSEEFLAKTLDKVIPSFEKLNLPCERFKFSIELLLTDMFLREGDIEAAANEMKKCRTAEAALPASLENMLYYYQLIEKEALLCIDSFDFRKGAELMNGACEGFKGILECITLVDSLKKRYPNIISEYYGDALCMKIYAELFLQRFSPELYPSLKEDSDIALKQYGPHEGELERHRQYRSVIELQNGDFVTAAKWLLMTQPGKINMSSLETDTPLTKNDFDAFLKSVITGEGKSARRYYLMYYVKIMAEAALANNDIADMMALALKDNPGIQDAEDIKDTASYRTDHGTQVSEQRVKSLDHVIRPAKYVDYHPLEVNYWKQATYEFAGKKYAAAEKQYEKALKVCYTYSNYIQLAVIGFGIWSEYIVCLLDQGKERKAFSEYDKLLKKIERKKKSTSVPKINSFIKTIYDALVSAKKDNMLDREKIWKASRMITF